MGFCIYNGKIIDAGECFISPNSRGFRFGDGIFETIKCRQNQVLFVEEHFNRLLNGLKVLQFDRPKKFTAQNLGYDIQKLLKKNGHQKMARVRVTVFRGDRGLFDTVNQKPNYLIQSWALPAKTGEWNSNGLLLGIYGDVKKSQDILCNLKHNNFLPYVMAALYCKKQKWNDAIILNTDGRICETSIANIFLIKNNIVYTPGLDEGCIAGIMRMHIITTLVANKVQVVQTKISLQVLMGADEIFLSNSIYGLRWVQCIGDKKYKNAYTQKIYSILKQTII